MKKYILFVGLLWSSTVVRAQGRLGIQIAPTLSFSRVHTSPSNAGFASKGVSFRFKLGAIYDLPFRDNYYLSTGLFYAVHQFALKNENLLPKVQEVHELHYLQAPLLFKLYTSEITLDTRIYATLGIVGKIMFTARNTQLGERKEACIDLFRRWGLSGLLGAGVEYDTSFSTSVFAGLSYQWSLASGIQQRGSRGSKVMGYSDLVSIDLGARF